MYQNNAWRKETGFTLGFDGKPLEKPVSEIKGEENPEAPLPDIETQEDDEAFEKHEREVFRDVGISEKEDRRDEEITFNALDEMMAIPVKRKGVFVSEASEYIKSHPEFKAEYGEVTKEAGAIIVKDSAGRMNLVFPDQIVKVK